MRFVSAAVLLALSVTPAFAQIGTGPVIVVPGRPDIPIIVNGVDISWAVVESELGLARPGVLTPTVIYRIPPPVVAYAGPATYQPGFFPQDGKKPGYGRLEVVPGPNRPLPPKAQSYRRSWSSTSAPTPADLPSATQPYMAPPIIAPQINGPFYGPSPWRGGAGGPGGPGGRR